MSIRMEERQHRHEAWMTGLPPDNPWTTSRFILKHEGRHQEDRWLIRPTTLNYAYRVTCRKFLARGPKVRTPIFPIHTMMTNDD